MIVQNGYHERPCHLGKAQAAGTTIVAVNNWSSNICGDNRTNLRIAGLCCRQTLNEGATRSDASQREIPARELARNLADPHDPPHQLEMPSERLLHVWWHGAPRIDWRVLPLGRAKGRLDPQLPGARPLRPAGSLSPDGLSGGNDGTTRLWDLETGKQIGRFDEADVRIVCVAFSPDGKTFACTIGWSKSRRRLETHSLRCFRIS